MSVSPGIPAWTSKYMFGNVTPFRAIAPLRRGVWKEATWWNLPTWVVISPASPPITFLKSPERKFLWLAMVDPASYGAHLQKQSQTSYPSKEASKSQAAFVAAKGNF
ncbi:hypothetical protein AVEN_135126-1 [Araneus ventricosus]|uniref:Uncharacterized protein n=1 Tax=Araneus ventricosus TaxID=182803 RepID=A0A4Y2HGE3_ARAVE|nr:hypothetical protein AVEN_135126-1 [Araneus ventricosus]